MRPVAMFATDWTGSDGLSLLECALIAVIYYLCTDGLGSLLQSREQQILETVTAKAA